MTLEKRQRFYGIPAELIHCDDAVDFAIKLA